MSREVERGGDAGAILAEYVMVSALLVALMLGVVQLAVTLHVRNVLTSSASEGARLAGAYDRSDQDGLERTESLIDGALGGYEHATSVTTAREGGLNVVTVTVESPVPVVGLWGFGSMTVSAHAVKESSDG